MNKPLPEENLGLVHLCANRFRGRGIEYDDLYSAGCIGLLKAAEAFDCERGVKFSTYAVPVILGEIKRLFRDGGTVKVSRSLKELSLKADVSEMKCQRSLDVNLHCLNLEKSWILTSVPLQRHCRSVYLPFLLLTAPKRAADRYCRTVAGCRNRRYRCFASGSGNDGVEGS